MRNYIVNGRVPMWVARVNRHTDKLLRAGRICTACGQLFIGLRAKSIADPTVCRECYEATRS